MSDARGKFWCWSPDIGEAEEDGGFVDVEWPDHAAEVYAERHVLCDGANPQDGCIVFVRDENGVRRKYSVSGEYELTWLSVEMELDNQ